MKILVHTCLSYLLLCNNLPRHFVILKYTISHNFCASGIQVQLRWVLWLEVSRETLQSMYWLDCCGLKAKRGKNLLPRPSKVVRLRISVPRCLMARSHPQFLAT